MFYPTFSELYFFQLLCLFCEIFKWDCLTLSNTLLSAASHSAHANQLHANRRATAAPAGAGTLSKRSHGARPSEQRHAWAAASGNAPEGENRRPNRQLVDHFPHFTSCFNSLFCITSVDGCFKPETFNWHSSQREEQWRFVSLTTEWRQACQV